MRIGIISAFPHSEKVEIRGGDEARTFHIAKHLVRRHEVTVITSREEGTERDDNILGMKVFRVGRSRRYSQSGSFVERASFMREAIREGNKKYCWSREIGLLTRYALKITYEV